MEVKDFTCTIFTDKTPEDVFDTVRNVRLWWSGLYAEEFTGSSEKLDDEFSFRAGDGAHYSKQKLIEIIPNQRLVWRVEESALTFLHDTSEWTGTTIAFDIHENSGKTQITFTHSGLTPEMECYTSCAPAWTAYLQEKLTPLLNGNKQ